MKGAPAVLVVVMAIVTALGQQNVAVGPGVQVSIQRPDWEHNEVVLATDQNDANHMLAGAMFLDPAKGGYGVVTYVSFDGGKSWDPTLTVGREWGHYGDPATAFGCDGAAYSVSLKAVGPRSDFRTLVHRSPDGGKTWLLPTELPFSDREYVTVDCSNSKYRGRIYIHGNRRMQTTDGESIAGTIIFGSGDNGKSFSETTITPLADHINTYQGNGVVLSNGIYIAPFTNTPRGNQPNLLQFFRSDDGGRTFSKAITIGEKGDDQALPTFAVDQSKGVYQDRIYAAWSAVRFGRSRILLSYSSDKGNSWSKPMIVDDEVQLTDVQKAPNNFMATVSVNRDGVVGVMWYDRRDSTNNLDWQVRFAASLDGGETFSPSVKIPDAVFSNQKAPSSVELRGGGGADYEYPGKALSIVPFRSRSYAEGGDTAGLSTTPDGVFHALWVDNRTGRGQVWTAPIKVEGRSNPNTPPELNGLDDITRKLSVEFDGQEYNAETGTLSYKACLVNMSDETLIGPIKARVVEIRPDGAEILNADNGLAGTGAVWDFSPLLSNSKLEPGKRTGCKSFSLRIVDKAATSAGQKGITTQFPAIQLRVFGKELGR